MGPLCELVIFDRQDRALPLYHFAPFSALPPSPPPPSFPDLSVLRSVQHFKWVAAVQGWSGPFQALLGVWVNPSCLLLSAPLRSRVAAAAGQAFCGISERHYTSIVLFNVTCVEIMCSC